MRVGTEPRRNRSWRWRGLAGAWILIAGWTTRDLVLPYLRTTTDPLGAVHVEWLTPGLYAILLWVTVAFGLPLADLALAACLAGAARRISGRSNRPVASGIDGDAAGELRR